MAEAEASFNTEIEAISDGFRKSMLSKNIPWNWNISSL
jgi:hypothetical protein